MTLPKLATFLITFLILLPGHVRASEAWLCEDSTGRRYQVSQNVPSDSCKKLEGLQLDEDLASIELPKRLDLKWGVEHFCKGRPAAKCQVSDDGLERAALDGVWFRLFADSAVVAGAEGHMPDSGFDPINWSVSCSRDKMSSVRSCMIKKGDLHVFVYSSGKLSVSVGYEHFPGSQTSIKIGTKRFDTSDRDGDFNNGAQLVNMMSNGAKVVTRYMRWPYREYVDDEFAVYGLSTSLAVAKWLLKNGNLG